MDKMESENFYFCFLTKYHKHFIFVSFGLYAAREKWRVQYISKKKTGQNCSEMMFRKTKLLFY